MILIYYHFQFIYQAQLLFIFYSSLFNLFISWLFSPFFTRFHYFFLFVIYLYLLTINFNFFFIWRFPPSFQFKFFLRFSKFIFFILATYVFFTHMTFHQMMTHYQKNLINLIPFVMPIENEHLLKSSALRLWLIPKLFYLIFISFFFLFPSNYFEYYS
jgi:hypothetical protein